MRVTTVYGFHLGSMGIVTSCMPPSMPEAAMSCTQSSRDIRFVTCDTHIYDRKSNLNRELDHVVEPLVAQHLHHRCVAEGAHVGNHAMCRHWYGPVGCRDAVESQSNGQ